MRRSKRAQIRELRIELARARSTAEVWNELYLGEKAVADKRLRLITEAGAQIERLQRRVEQQLVPRHPDGRFAPKGGETKRPKHRTPTPATPPVVEDHRGSVTGALHAPTRTAGPINSGIAGFGFHQH